MQEGGSRRGCVCVYVCVRVHVCLKVGGCEVRQGGGKLERGTGQEKGFLGALNEWEAGGEVEMGGSHVRVGRSRVGGQWENRVEYGREVAPFTKAPAASPDSGAERPSLNATPVPPPHQVPPAIPSPPACWVPSAAPSQSTPGTLARTSPAPSPSCPRLSTRPTSTPTLWPVPWATCPQQGQGEAPALRPCWLPPRRA